MATFNFTLTYPDGQKARILAALKHSAETDQNPNPSNADAIEWFRQACTHALKDVVKRYETEQAVNSAIESVSDTDIS